MESLLLSPIAKFINAAGPLSLCIQLPCRPHYLTAGVVEQLTYFLSTAVGNMSSPSAGEALMLWLRFVWARGELSGILQVVLKLVSESDLPTSQSTVEDGQMDPVVKVTLTLCDHNAWDGTGCEEFSLQGRTLKYLIGLWYGCGIHRTGVHWGFGWFPSYPDSYQYRQQRFNISSGWTTTIVSAVEGVSCVYLKEILSSTSADVPKWLRGLTRNQL